ncbi:MAG: CopG family antitoxin [Pseudorhodoplanes sp.]|jgi:predicted DNA binding CopG/RHH family protein|nr:CopG family antitoxin [Pseudorhodoplanes sp.]
MPTVRTSEGAAPDQAKSGGPQLLSNRKKDDVQIRLRLPTGTLDRIKIAASRRDVPYQSLIKTWLKEKVDAD